MKRLRSKSAHRASKDTERLVSLCAAAVASGSNVEANFWFRTINHEAAALMERGNDAAIESALDQTFQHNPAGHELLAGAAEAAAESVEFTHEGKTFVALLVAVPLITWSKYSIAWGKISEKMLAPVRDALAQHIVAEAAAFTVNPYLYALDQLPIGYAATRKLTKKMADAALDDKAASIDYAKLGETADMPADVRLLLACVVAEQHTPHFRWQAPDQIAADAVKPGTLHGTRDSLGLRAQSLMQWIEHCRPHLAKLIPGAAFECGLPDAYFHNCREMDRGVRPVSLTATLDEMETLLPLPRPEMSVVVAGVGENQVDEYRIGITRRGHDGIFHGIIWPLFGNEDDDSNPSPRDEIAAILKGVNVKDVHLLSGTHRPEFCDDCGAPLYFNADGEAVHAELPEDSDGAGSQPAHYH
jgi:hypothetical protein